MLSRKELKTEAKEVLRNHYWLSVICGLLLAIGAAVSQAFHHIASVIRTGEEFLNIIENPRLYEITLWFLAGAAFGAVIFILLRIFFTNVLTVGAAEFFLDCNYDEPVSFKTMFEGFKGENYIHNVHTLFVRDLYVLLWSCLLIVPGIIKALEYAMVDFIIAEMPEADYKKALMISSKLMEGYKWRYFVLELSFIAWYLLDILTLGVLDKLWVQPYRNHTRAGFYLELKRMYMEKSQQ